MGSYDRIEYRLVQQQDSDSEGEDTRRRSRSRIEIPSRVKPRSDRMNLSIHNRPLFQAAYLSVALIGLTMVITTIAWVGHFKGGVSFSQTEKGIDFNWHPILMTISLIFLYGNGALIYRVIPPRNESHKLKLKLGHAGIMMFAFILMVIGLQAAFDSHNLAVPPKANMYTLHSWIGLMAALLFGVQWALGFSAFLFPKFSPEIRSFLLPFHQYFGSSIICLAVAAALLGHLEKALWSITTPVYASKNSESQLVNWIGICLVLFVMGVTFLLSKFKTENPKGHMAVN